jgi:hypothetical protein
MATKLGSVANYMATVLKPRVSIVGEDSLERENRPSRGQNCTRFHNLVVCRGLEAGRYSQPKRKCFDFVSFPPPGKNQEWFKERLAVCSIARRIVGLMLLSIAVMYSRLASMPHETAIFATTTIAATQADPESESGINGEVIIRPVRPHATVGEKNLAPYQATIEVVDSNGRLVASIQSGPEGNFRVGLPPGTYTLRPQSPGPYPHASTQTVVVEPKTFSQVRIIYDSGMR